MVFHAEILGGFGTSQIATYILWGAIILGSMIITGGIVFYIIIKKMYYKQLVIFEKVGGNIQVTKKDTARDIRLGEAGDYILHTRRFKKFLPSPTIQTGINTFWYYIREDGEWINFGLEDIDAVMRKAKAHFLDKEMRYARTAMQKNLKDRLLKITFWDKYGAMLMWTMYIAIVGIMTYLLFDKWIELSSEVARMVDTSAEVMELARDVLQNVDNIKSGGSGIETT